MMGEQSRTEPLFYYFRLEDQIPAHHLLRRIDRYVDFSFVRERLRGAYSHMGRPSIDPEILLRLLLVGYLYGITSERRLMEEVRMHLRTVGSPGWALSKRFPITRLSPRTATAGFGIRVSS
jgi:transposase